MYLKMSSGDQPPVSCTLRLHLAPAPYTCNRILRLAPAPYTCTFHLQVFEAACFYGPKPFRRCKKVAKLSINIPMAVAEVGVCSAYILFVAENIQQVVVVVVVIVIVVVVENHW